MGSSGVTATTLPEPVLRWAARSVGADAIVSAVHELRPGRSPWHLQIDSANGEVHLVLKAGRDLSSEIRTEVAALRVAEEHALPAPRVLAADLSGEEAGAPAVLMSWLEGQSHVPMEADPERLRALGAAAAAFHLVERGPSPDLPLRQRHMPWIDLARERREGIAATTPLLDAADKALGDAGPVDDETVFVHGDLWAGNTMWLDGVYVGTIDWEAGGVGSYGVDLGSLRLDAALSYGQHAAAEITLGWERESGRQARALAVWDIVAALNTPPEMDPFLPTMHEAGRVDLDGPTLTSRRDGFLEAALEQVRG